MRLKKSLFLRSLGILLLFLTGLNTIGYYGLLWITKKELTHQILRKIDENANEISGNLILKIPMTLPYSMDSKEYERTNGEVYYEGEVYRFIKQRLHQDTLYIVCIRDHQGTVIKNMMSEYSLTFANETQHDSGLKLFVAQAKYYLLFYQSTRPAQGAWEQPLTRTGFVELYQFQNQSGIFHPPQFLSA